MEDGLVPSFEAYTIAHQAIAYLAIAPLAADDARHRGPLTPKCGNRRRFSPICNQCKPPFIPYGARIRSEDSALPPEAGPTCAPHAAGVAVPRLARSRISCCFN